MFKIILMTGFVALQGAQVHPVSGPPIDDATILIYGDRVLKVGKDVKIPATATKVDVSGKVITPGFVHAWSQLGLTEVTEVSETNDGQLRQEDDEQRKAIRAAFEVVDEINPRSSLIPIARASGVTSAVVAPSGGLISGQAAWIDLAGTTTDDMVQRSSIAFVADVRGDGKAKSGGRGGAWMKLREALDDARVYQRMSKAFEHNQTREFVAHRLDLQALQPLLRREVPLVIRADRATDIRTAIKLGREFRIRVVVLGATEGWLVADDLAAAKVPVIVRYPQDIPFSFDGLAARVDNPARLVSAGVTIALIPSFWGASSHSMDRVRQEAANVVIDGLSREAALAAITRNPAEILGIGKGVGELAPGSPATFVIWSGDPFRVETVAEHVYIRGEEQTGPTRQDLLLKRYRNFPVHAPAVTAGGATHAPAN